MKSNLDCSSNPNLRERILHYVCRLNEVKDTVKPVYNDHPWDPNTVAVVDRWSLFRGYLCNKSPNRDIKIVVVVDRLSLFGDGR